MPGVSTLEEPVVSNANEEREPKEEEKKEQKAEESKKQNGEEKDKKQNETNDNETSKEDSEKKEEKDPAFYTGEEFEKHLLSLDFSEQLNYLMDRYNPHQLTGRDTDPFTQVFLLIRALSQIYLKDAQRVLTLPPLEKNYTESMYNLIEKYDDEIENKAKKLGTEIRKLFPKDMFPQLPNEDPESNLFALSYATKYPTIDDPAFIDAVKYLTGEYPSKARKFNLVLFEEFLKNRSDRLLERWFFKSMLSAAERHNHLLWLGYVKHWERRVFRESIPQLYERIGHLRYKRLFLAKEIVRGNWNVHYQKLEGSWPPPMQLESTEKPDGFFQKVFIEPIDKIWNRVNFFFSVKSNVQTKSITVNIPFLSSAPQIPSTLISALTSLIVEKPTPPTPANIPEVSQGETSIYGFPVKEIDWSATESSTMKLLRKFGFVSQFSSPASVIPQAKDVSFPSNTTALVPVPDFLSFDNPYVLPSLAPKIIDSFLKGFYRVALRTELAPLLLRQAWFRSRAKHLHRFENDFKYMMLKAYCIQYPYFSPRSFRRRMKRVLLTIFNALFTGNYDFFKSFFRDHYSAQQTANKWVNIMENRTHPWIVNKLRVKKVRRVMYRLCYVDPKHSDENYQDTKNEERIQTREVGIVDDFPVAMPEDIFEDEYKGMKDQSPRWVWVIRCKPQFRRTLYNVDGSLIYNLRDFGNRAAASTVTFFFFFSNVSLFFFLKK